MHFKHPEILYFLFFLLVPILVHLFQLRRFKKQYFTNVQFLKTLSIQSRKSSKIKKRLLLICRMLLLAFLILAFAQPFFDSKDSKNKTNEMYVILDNSFSMQAKGKKGELLKRTVQDLLEEMPENTNFSILTNSETYWNTDIKTAENVLQKITYSALPFQLEQILTKIKTHKSVFKKDIVIVTDGIGLKKRQLQNISNKNTWFVTPKAEQKNNVSVDSVFIAKTQENFYEIGVHLTGYGENTKPIPMALYNNNKLIAKTIVSLEKNQKTSTFAIPKTAFNGYVSIEDNCLAFDNNFYFSISDIKKCNVISIGDENKSGFLSRIYTSDEFNYANFDLKSLDYNNLENQNAIILNELDQIPQSLQTTLKTVSNKGGNVIVIPAETATPESTNTFLKSFENIVLQPMENKEKLITKISFEHPVFKGVFESKINNFQYPKTQNSFKLNSNIPAVLTYDDQSPFLISQQNNRASISVFAAPLNSTNSNFQQSPLIVPVFYKMAMNNQNLGVKALIIGNNNPYFINTNLTKESILVLKNTEEQFIPVQQISNGNVKMFFNDYPKKAGNFDVFNQKEKIENLSFNYNRNESNINLFDKNIFENYRKSDSVANILNDLNASRTDNSFWKWLLFLALLLFVIEMAIVRFVK